MAVTAQAGQAIGIFEIPDRNLRTPVPTFFLVPLLVAITTPFIRPFRWRRLLWTYLLPLVPPACWWDGTARTFSALLAKRCAAFSSLAPGASKLSVVAPALRTWMWLFSEIASAQGGKVRMGPV